MHRGLLTPFSGAFLSGALFLAAFVLVTPTPSLAGASPRKKTVSIAVVCEGSWKLRYKLYYHEIADSETRGLVRSAERNHSRK
jgi:hypothetical protein